MTPLEIPPGIVSMPTIGSRSTNWREGNLMRWSQGRMTPIGGWTIRNYTAFASRLRYIHEWVSLDGDKLVAYLCEGHLYVDYDGEIHDVSPTVPIVAPSSDISAGGYGEDPYGVDEYGTPRSDRVRDKPVTPAYKLDNWGEDLLAMTSPDGRLLRWSPSTPTTVAAVVPNAPTGNRTFIVTSERFVILFQAGGVHNKFKWCDQEDIEEWTVSTSTKAGEFEVEPSAPIVAAEKGHSGVVFHTTKKAYVINYIGLPYIFNYQEIGEASTPISAASMKSAGDYVLWVSEDGFWQFNGISIQPVECPLWSYIQKRIHGLYSRYEATMVSIVTKSEMWWFFVSTDSRYNDLLIIYNYREGWWSQGKMSRSCGASSSYVTAPIMSDGEKVYDHEKGEIYSGVPEGAWIETFSLNVDGGVSTMMLRQLIPDVEGAYENVGFRFFASDTRAGTSQPNFTRSTPQKTIRSNGYVDVRITGRDIRMRVESIVAKGTPWTLGNTLMDMVPRGARGNR